MTSTVFGEEFTYAVTGSMNGELDGIYTKGEKNTPLFDVVIHGHAIIHSQDHNLVVVGDVFDESHMNQGPGKWLIGSFSWSYNTSIEKLVVKSYADANGNSSIGVQKIYGILGAWFPGTFFLPGTFCEKKKRAWKGAEEKDTFLPGTFFLKK